MKHLVCVTLAICGFMLSGCDSSSKSKTETETETETAQDLDAQGERKVVVFSARKQHLIDPLFEAFTEDTGIKVEYITDKAQPLIARIKASGAKPDADVFMAVDAGSLWSAAEQGILQGVQSKALEGHIPETLRDSEGRWFGLSQRARTIVYSTERVDPKQLSTYGSLADKKWEGKLCLRTSAKIYNQSLVAMLLELYGETKLKALLEQWVNNLAVPVFSSDSLLVQAIASGECDVGIVNTYYVGQELAKDKDLPVGVFWANQDTGGVHVNISGAGVVKNAAHKDEAIALLEWLVSDKAQQKFAGLNYEFPIVDGIALEPLVASWGRFKADQTPIEKAGQNQAKAIMLMDEAGYK